MNNVLFPGSFDPPTNGHLDIISRCSKVFSHVTILVADNPNKASMFNTVAKVELIKEMISEFSNVSVDYYDGLVVEYAKLNGINIIVRGVRNSSDYNYESELEAANTFISNSVETIFMNARPDLVNTKSSLVKELFRYNVDVSSLVAPSVYKAMKDQC